RYVVHGRRARRAELRHDELTVGRQAIARRADHIRRARARARIELERDPGAAGSVLGRRIARTAVLADGRPATLTRSGPGVRADRSVGALERDAALGAAAVHVGTARRPCAAVLVELEPAAAERLARILAVAQRRGRRRAGSELTGVIDGLRIDARREGVG